MNTVNESLSNDGEITRCQRLRADALVQFVTR